MTTTQRAPFMLVTIGELPSDFHQIATKEDLASFAAQINQDPEKLVEEIVFDVPDIFLGIQYADWANSKIDAMPVPTEHLEKPLKYASRTFAATSRYMARRGCSSL